jgi:PIN domain nuclease of toxin-antitoxin system
VGGDSLTWLLDTHILLWWLADSDELGPERAAALTRPEGSGEPLAIAAISLWEIAKLVEKQRIRLQATVDVVLADIERSPHIRVLPLTASIALESTRLGPRFPRDPADQIIAATCRVHGLRLVTVDERIRDSGTVSCL